MNVKSVIAAACFVLTLSFSSVLRADDTEIFFSQGAGDASTESNLILILDNSGSMLRDGVNGTTSKLDDLKAAMHEILDVASNVNIGIVNFLSTDDNHGSRLVFPVTSIDEPGAREAMKDVVTNMEGETYTPIVGALYESAMIFRGGLIEDTSAVYTSPILSECQSNQIVLLSDGQPFKNEAVSKTEDLIGYTCAPTGTDDGEIGRKCGYELAEWIFETDHAPSLPEDMNISISTVGFNITSSFLSDVADIAGGKYYEAESSSDLIDVFSEILSEVQETDTTFKAPATSINQYNRLSHSSDVYFAMFKPESTESWSGNLKRYEVVYEDDDVFVADVNGDVAIDPDSGLFLDSSTSFWSDIEDGNSVALGGAAGEIESIDRNVLTHLGDISAGGELLSDSFQASNNSLASYFPDLTEAERELVIDWARGEDSKNEDPDSNERRHMGDILHSAPVVVNYSSNTLIYVGTNDGFLHAIERSTGDEVFSFIPQDLIPNLADLYTDASTRERAYGLDGDITLHHVDDDGNSVVDGGDKAYLYFGMRRGGNNYYAMDVTNPNAPKLMWTIEGGVDDYDRLGQTWSKPIATKIIYRGAEKEVLIFGGGYDPTNHDTENSSGATSSRPEDSVGNTVFMADALSGDLLWSAYDDLRVASTEMTYSIPSDLRVIDINGDSLADRIYVGDLGGQVWRFDIDSYHQDDGGDLVDGGLLASLSTTSNDIRFYNEPDTAIVVDEGQRFMSVSIGSGWRAHPLDTVVVDNLYMIRDNSPLTKPEGYGIFSGTVWNPVVESDLIDVTDTVSSERSNGANLEGWMLRLTTAGEKNLSRAITIFNQVLFSTYAPSAVTDICVPVTGQAFLYALDVVTGDPVLQLSGSSSASGEGTVDDRKIGLNTQSIPPGPTALIIDSGGEMRGSVMVGTETVLEDLPFSQFTQRTYWQDNKRGNSTPAECRTGISC